MEKRSSRVVKNDEELRAELGGSSISSEKLQLRGVAAGEWCCVWAVSRSSRVWPTLLYTSIYVRRGDDIAPSVFAPLLGTTYLAFSRIPSVLYPLIGSNCAGPSTSGSQKASELRGMTPATRARGKKADDTDTHAHACSHVCSLLLKTPLHALFPLNRSCASAAAKSAARSHRPLPERGRLLQQPHPAAWRAASERPA